ncbi:MAG: hypothetical protein O3A00_27355 [Planctomycetota bacterium]|nr:hypothetical protein [Planctomycetota bacterium]
MFQPDFLVATGFVALAAILLPVKRWQKWLQLMLTKAFRVSGLALVAVGAWGYSADKPVPVELSRLLGPMEPEWLSLTACGLVPLTVAVWLLSYTGRMSDACLHIEALRRTLDNTRTLASQFLDELDEPGASPTPERRAQLKSALANLRSGSSRTDKPVVRKTLSEFVK